MTDNLPLTTTLDGIGWVLLSEPTAPTSSPQAWASISFGGIHVESYEESYGQKLWEIKVNGAKVKSGFATKEAAMKRAVPIVKTVARDRLQRAKAKVKEVERRCRAIGVLP